jgi:6-pyruvoyltetrahydropterin/6-carboxytetrahydropterin synthase
VLEVKVSGYPDPVTGFVMDMKELSNIVKDEIHSRFDHKNLNLDTSYFKNLNPTAENIAIIIYQLLRPCIKKDLDLRIKLFETDRNYVAFPSD